MFNIDLVMADVDVHTRHRLISWNDNLLARAHLTLNQQT